MGKHLSDGCLRAKRNERGREGQDVWKQAEKQQIVERLWGEEQTQVLGRVCFEEQGERELLGREAAHVAQRVVSRWFVPLEQRLEAL